MLNVKNIILYSLLAPLAARIDIEGVIKIDNINDLALLFHSNLKKFYFSYRTIMKIDISNPNWKVTVQLAKLDEICFRLSIGQNDTMNDFHTIISNLDKFNLRYFVKHYRLEWFYALAFESKQLFGNQGFVFNKEKSIFDKFVLSNKKNHPFVRKVTFVIDDTKYLHYCASIFLYLHANKLRLKHLDKIIIEWKEILAKRVFSVLIVIQNIPA